MSTVTEPGGDSRRLTQRIAFRLAAGLVSVGVVAMAAVAAVNLHLQREHLLGLVEARADQLAEVVLAATRGAMLTNDEQELLRIVETIAAEEEMRWIRIFDRDGRIQYTNVPDVTGHVLATDDFPCIGCHRTAEPLADLPRSERVRIIDDPEGGARLLEVMAPIHNEEQCAAPGCHVSPEEQKVLGVLDAQLSLAAVESDLAISQRELALGLLVGVALILATFGWLTWRLVVRPVEELTAATQRVAGGDLSARVEVDSGDEIGDMGRAWNRMVEELAAARARLERWGAELEERVDDKTAELRRTQEQMIQVERMASLGRLAAEVAHEINNPLSGIAMYARLLRRRLESRQDSGSGGAAGADPASASPPADGAGPAPATATPDSSGGEGASAAGVLEMIDEEARRCGQIVRNLLLFSRTPGARFSETELEPILERCRMLVKHKAGLDSIEVRCVHDPDTPSIVADAAQIQQMVLALVVNAVEACGEGDVVTISTAPGGELGGVEVRVTDTGRGIPAEHLDKLFEPFFSTKEESSGVGLGLSVVYGIVQRHHGHIDVRSELGMGTEMIVSLPLEQPEDEEEPERPTTEVFAPGHDRGGEHD